MSDHITNRDRRLCEITSWVYTRDCVRSLLGYIQEIICQITSRVGTGDCNRSLHGYVQEIVSNHFTGMYKRLCQITSRVGTGDYMSDHFTCRYSRL